MPRYTLFRRRSVLFLSALAWAITSSSVAVAQQTAGDNAPEVAKVLREFSSEWPTDRTPYRTDLDTSSWKVYAMTMKQLVAMGDRAVPGLIAGCSDDNFQVRALSARVLGYLQASPSVPTLIELLVDKNATVALQAADSLGQIQDPRGLKALEAARKTEKRGDVLLHVNKSLQREVPLEDDVVDQILKINGDTIDSAKVGQIAPDFTLKDSDGNAWKLSDLRGKKSVALVFIYGDG